jgi:hypothetical protein
VHKCTLIVEDRKSISTKKINNGTLAVLFTRNNRYTVKNQLKKNKMQIVWKRQTVIHIRKGYEKKQKSKISCQGPFNEH